MAELLIYGDDIDDPDPLDDDEDWCSLCGDERPCECDEQLRDSDDDEYDYA